MALRHLGRSASTQNAIDLDEARDLLVRAAPRVIDLVADPERLLRGGRIKLALGRSTDVFRLTREFNDVRFVVPREGVLLNVTYACVPTSAQHPELAFGFLDYLLSPEVAIDIGRERLMPRLSISAKRAQGADARDQWAVFETVRQRSQGFDTLRDVGPALPAYERAWKAVREAVQRAREQRTTPAPDPAPRR
jgi:spermidine/putrescine-binding protein